MNQEQESLQRELGERKALEDAAREELIEVQSRIASLSDGIEKNKSDIIELLNSRASTKAKIQKYDTMLEQIQVRKAQLNQRILEARSEAEIQNEEKNKYAGELQTISDEIIKFSKEHSDYEKKIDEIQGTLWQKRRRSSNWSDRISQRAVPDLNL